MQLKERHDWANIYRASTAYTLTKTNWVGATTREFIQVFQPEVFPTKKHCQLAYKKLSKDIKQEGTIRIIYLTSKQLQ